MNEFLELTRQVTKDVAAGRLSAHCGKVLLVSIHCDVVNKLKSEDRSLCVLKSMKIKAWDNPMEEKALERRTEEYLSWLSGL